MTLFALQYCDQFKEEVERSLQEKTINQDQATTLYKVFGACSEFIDKLSMPRPPDAIAIKSEKSFISYSVSTCSRFTLCWLNDETKTDLQITFVNERHGHFQLNHSKWNDQKNPRLFSIRGTPPIELFDAIRLLHTSPVK